jgi:hypothetical protein
MPGNRKIDHENGQLSLDFIIGFTIFMIAFIFVATMISGLLINLQTMKIDYDAVAYRTGVVLVEDPGEPSEWNLLDLTKQEDRDNLRRLGLSVARNSPGMLRESKIEKFFSPDSGGCGDLSRLCYPSDYSQKLIFGDYPYSFNISLKDLESGELWTIGEIIPPNHNIGYIRRVVNIKKSGYANISPTNPAQSNNITINMKLQNLYFPDPNSPSIDPAYQIDLIYEDFSFYLKGFSGKKLTKKPELYDGTTPVDYDENSPTIRIYNAGGEIHEGDYPVILDDNTEIHFEEGFLKTKGFHESSDLDFILTFDQPVSDGIALNLADIAERYPLTAGILEIWIW